MVESTRHTTFRLFVMTLCRRLVAWLHTIRTLGPDLAEHLDTTVTDLGDDLGSRSGVTLTLVMTSCPRLVA